MWYQKIIQSFSNSNFDAGDVYVSRWMYYHREDKYKAFLQRIDKIKEGDTSICGDMMSALWDNASKNLKDIVRMFTESPQSAIHMTFGGIRQYLSPAQVRLVNEYEKGKPLFWVFDSGEISVENKGTSFLKGSFRLTKYKEKIAYDYMLPLRVRTYIKENYTKRIFCEGVKGIPIIRFLYHHNFFTSFFQKIESLSTVFVQNKLFDFINCATVIVFCEFPEIIMNIRKNITNKPSDFAICMYHFIMNDQGLLRIATILSNFYSSEAGTEGLYAIRTSSRHMADYSISRGQSSREDWHDMIDKMPREVKSDLGQSILELIVSLKNSERRPHVVISLEEMMGKPIGEKMVDVVCDYFKEYGKNATSVAILYEMLCNCGLMHDLRDNGKTDAKKGKVFTKTAFKITVTHEFGVKIADSTYSTKCNDIEYAIKQNRVKKLSKEQKRLKDMYEESFSKWHNAIKRAAQE